MKSSCFYVNQLVRSARKPHFGLNTQDSSYLLTGPQTHLLDSLRDDLRYPLDQLRDIAISKRIFFFNKDDLMAVQLLAAEAEASSRASQSPPPPLSSSSSSVDAPQLLPQDADQVESGEAQRLLAEAQVLVEKITSLVQAM